MKQFVKEVHTKNDVIIFVNDCLMNVLTKWEQRQVIVNGFVDNDVLHLKEREELVIEEAGNKVVKYWIEVQDVFVGQKEENKKLQKENLKQQKFLKLCAEKRERIERYRKMIEMRQSIVPTSADINSALTLQSIIGRSKNITNLLGVKNA